MRFDDHSAAARRAVEEADRRARAAARVELTGDELLAVLVEGGDHHAGSLWGHLGTDRVTLAGRVAEMLDALPRGAPATRTVIAPGLVEAFERARSSARAEGAPVVETGHLLVALAATPTAGASERLAEAGCTVERLAGALRRAPNPERDEAREPSASRAAGGAASADPERFTVDLTARAAEGRLDPPVARDETVRRLIETLCRRRKRNPLLIGEPGVGKTALAEGLAQRIADDDVPDALRGRRMLVLDVGALLAGARARGDLEERLEALLATIRDSDGRDLLFVDELHELVGAGAGGGPDAAGLLKPALARGELRCLGATTPREHRRHIEPDAALARRFQTVHVAEPDAEEARTILRGVAPRYELHHGLAIDDAALEAAVRLSSRYVSERKLPDKALDLIDEAASRLRLELDALPASIEELRRRVERLAMERTALERDGSPDAGRRLHEVEAEEARLREQLDADLTQWRRERELLGRIGEAREALDRLGRDEERARRHGELDRAAALRFTERSAARRRLASLEGELAVVQKDGGWLEDAVGAEHVARAVADWTGIPTTRLAESEASRLRTLEARLGGRIVGQDDAVAAVANALRRARSGVRDPRRPLGSLLFLGPTGVGKTHLAKVVAEELFDDARALIRLDMSELAERHATARLVGAPPGYVGYGEGGELTEALRRRPWSVVLLDEADKAHPEVFDLLLQVLDEGRLTDAMGRTVSFCHALIVLTANPGADAAATATAAPGEEGDRAMTTWLRERFRPELVQRIDEVVPFRPLDREAVRAIVGAELDGLVERLRGQGIELRVDEEAIERLAAEGHDPDLGARPIRRVLRRRVEDAVAWRILDGDAGKRLRLAAPSTPDGPPEIRAASDDPPGDAAAEAETIDDASAARSGE